MRTSHSPCVGAILALGLLAAAGLATAQPGANGCEACHLGLAGRLATPAQLVPSDVHGSRGFGCVDCHGGDGGAEDQARAKDPARGFRGAPTGASVIEVCARCHSDATLMRRFAPAQRVDQAGEYAVSVHGQRLAQGDLNVATCASCHGAHGIRRVSNVRSPVFPTNVASTCGGCHSDAARMQRYQLAGRPFPTTQQRDYETSVHYEALTAQNDLSAPACNDCHGNHGAAPPGVDAVTNVCGTCHASFAERFEPTTHAFVLERGCVDCHGNHAVAPASDEMVGTGPDAVCATCHTEGDTGFSAAADIRESLDHFKSQLEQVESLMRRARNAGMEMSGQEVTIRQARNNLTLARTELHTFDAAAVNGVLDEGLMQLTEVEAASQDALAELRYRRRGLAVSLALILLFVIGLIVKVRRLDRGARV